MTTDREREFYEAGCNRVTWEAACASADAVHGALPVSAPAAPLDGARDEREIAIAVLAATGVALGEYPKASSKTRDRAVQNAEATIEAVNLTHPPHVATAREVVNERMEPRDTIAGRLSNGHPWAALADECVELAAEVLSGMSLDAPDFAKRAAFWDRRTALGHAQMTHFDSLTTSPPSDPVPAPVDALRGAFVEGYAAGLRAGVLYQHAQPKSVKARIDPYVPVTQGRLDAEALWQEKWGQHFAPTTALPAATVREDVWGARETDAKDPNWGRVCTACKGPVRAGERHIHNCPELQRAAPPAAPLPVEVKKWAAEAPLLAWAIRFLAAWEPSAYRGMAHSAAVADTLARIGPPPSAPLDALVEFGEVVRKACLRKVEHTEGCVDDEHDNWDCHVECPVLTIGALSLPSLARSFIAARGGK